MSLACKEGNPDMRVSVYRYRYSVYMYSRRSSGFVPGQRDVVTCTSGAHRTWRGATRTIDNYGGIL